MTKPVAYLVLAHTDPIQCLRLVRSLLADVSAHVFVHVDLKTKSDFSRLSQMNSARIHLVRERHKVSWAGFSVVKATLACMQTACESGMDFGYLVLLSGMDYPIRHPNDIRSYLYCQPFRQHINRLYVADSPDHYLKLAQKFAFRDAWQDSETIDRGLRKLATIILTPFKRKLPEQTLCTGSTWWAMTGELGRYVLAFSQQCVDYERFFRYTHSPDELYFQTILQNSLFVREGPPVLTYSGRGMWKTANLHVIDPSLRKIYTASDFDELMASGRCFVRKVTTTASSALLDRLDLELGLYTDACSSPKMRLHCIPQVRKDEKSG